MHDDYFILYELHVISIVHSIDYKDFPREKSSCDQLEMTSRFKT